MKALDVIVVLALSVLFGYWFGKKILILFVIEFFAVCLLGVVWYSFLSKLGRVDMTTGLGYVALIIFLSINCNLLGAFLKESKKQKLAEPKK